MKNMINLIKVMLRIGCIGFGGGSALIPVIESETITDKKMISKEEYDKNVVVASITPGALPVEIASGIGYSFASYKGMAAAAFCMALPGAVFTILLLTIFSNIEAMVLQQVRYLSVGISVFIIYLLTHYISKTIKTQPPAIKHLQKSSSKKFTLWICLIITVVFLLNGEKEIYALFNLNLQPIFDVSSIQIIGLAFFLIFYLGEKRNIIKILVSAVLSIIYLFCVGKGKLIDNNWTEWIVKILMVLLGIYGFIRSLPKQPHAAKAIDLKKIGKTCLVWIVLVTIFLIPAVLFCKQALLYAGRGLLSSVLSFGGGDAYLSVAEGMFVNTGMIDSDIFFNQIVTVVNILPGSILCKTLSGAGYIIGYSASGSILQGILMAVAGFGISVFGSCIIFMVCLHAYTWLQNFELFNLIGRYIRPIISGLLINICLSLLKGNLNVSAVCGMPALIMIIFSVFVYGIVFLLRKKNIGYGKIIILVSVLALLVCNIS